VVVVGYVAAMRAGNMAAWKREAAMAFGEVSRREFARFGVAAAAAGVTPLFAGAQQPVAGRGASAPTQKPDALKSEFLMDLELVTGGGGSGTVGNRSIIAVTGGTFEGPKLKGRVMSPGADWPVTAGDGLRILDVRTVLMTDDEQRIYCSYRGVVYTPAAGQGERYWRITPAFETASEKYAWLNRIVAVGVSYTVPQRVSYRIFQIL
jgi:hypothetical protein